MRRTALVMLAVGTLLALCVTGALASGPDMRKVSAVPLPDSFFPAAKEFERGRADTIWLFDADFHNTIGDNAWTSYDVSGTLGQENYWHHDTIRNDDHGSGTSAPTRGGAASTTSAGSSRAATATSGPSTCGATSRARWSAWSTVT